MSRYCTFTLSELREELKSRNAKTSGRKKELIERLESYDRNNNFGRHDPQLPDYSMTVPEFNKYTDLNSDRGLAPLTMDKINTYLKTFDKRLENNAVQLYQEKYLCYVRLCNTGDYDFVRSACRAEMRKSVVYQVDVALHKDGHVQETQCECAAGMGPNAHCKHVCAVLYACTEFTSKKSVKTEQTCTQKLQSFHHTPMYKGSPMKARNIAMEGCDESTNVSTFDPRPVEYRNMPGYSDYFNNVCLNYRGVSSLPIFQLFNPANSFAVAHDHDYLVDCPEDIFLSSISVNSIDDKERTRVESMTRGQNSNKQWFNERQKRIHSFNYGRICKATEKTDFKALAKSLVNSGNRRIKSEAITHGLKYEKEALQRYAKDNNVMVKECGIFVSREYPFLGSSPDGVCDSQLICEVKCPFSAITDPLVM